MTANRKTVPTLDISDLCKDAQSAPDDLISQIGDVFQNIGFLSICGTGVNPDLVRNLRREIRNLFALPDEFKQKRAITRENYRGFIPLGFFTPNDDSGTPDRYEGYKLHFETDPADPVIDQCPLYGPNIWPDELPKLKQLTLEYWSEMDRINHALLIAIERLLGLTPQALTGLFQKPMTNMTFLHYPPQNPNESGYGIHAHKDTDALTIIAPDPVGGLEILLKNGEWDVVECPADGLVVNIGDMLELWSGGRLMSTPHRVVNRSGKDRISFPYFAVPRHDVTVSPLIDPLPGFNRPAVHTGHWSAEIWRTNWPSEQAADDTPELGTIHAPD